MQGGSSRGTSFVIGVDAEMKSALFSNLEFAPPEVTVDQRPDGSLILRSPRPLLPYARCTTEWLTHWAAKNPKRVYLMERAGAAWRRVTYHEALHEVRLIAQGLLERDPERRHPVAILSDNSVDHALLALACQHVGIPVAPISPAYSLMSKDFAKLRYILELVRPGIIWTAEPDKFAPALQATGFSATAMDELRANEAKVSVDEAHDAITPDSIAKILFTSGSTGTPKGVLNTHRMLCSNQQMLAQGWPFVEKRPPVVVDWLPWNHTFGGNHNFNLVLRNGGTLVIDSGKPVPGLIETTVRNLKEIAPTMYFNVPRGFDLLLPHLETDAELCENFFRDLDMVFYAAAALPQNLWERLEKLAVKAKGGNLAMLSAWGSTETSPLAAQVHFHIERAGVIGLPVAGCELKLVPTAGKLEVRVRGPHVTPGYWQREDLSRAAFDEEGFYCIGDAVKFADPENPAQGILFDGRVAEDFKLTSGTWVHVGAVRMRLIGAGNPILQDAVITGHGRDEIGALVFLSPAAQSMAPEDIREKLENALRTLANDGHGSSMCPKRLLILQEPASIDAGEITDKGYINQRAVLERRAALVDELYTGGLNVIRLI